MELKVLCMYPDIMDLYGDLGNITILKYRCLKRGINCIIDTYSIGDNKDFCDYDLIFLGGGSDKDQMLIFQDILDIREDIKKAIINNKFILLICDGYQLFGKYYIDSDGNKIEGLNLFDYYTESSSKGRCIGNIAIKPNIEGLNDLIVGFENHGGQTFGVSTPLGEVLNGHGNEFEGKFEGFFKDNVLGTYLHGPLLSKNPELVDFIIKKSIESKYGEIDLCKLDDSIEYMARDQILKKLNVK
ncbi:cobyric acid synthase [[Clostridium] sordellii]|uniref:type 1 glutamine amidotransferase n=1 Tax=Paraclostridium sordellii TaxID=1505 RepID=UPI00054433D3|nr:glutamine amidotransferase [Paeniclostridium sordellii]CEK31017.1 cobyric acid synthase [[Clostridium] sordellii] [Paeniclostridium sordellii]